MQKIWPYKNIIARPVYFVDTILLSISYIFNLYYKTYQKFFETEYFTMDSIPSRWQKFSSSNLNWIELCYIILINKRI